MHFCTILSFLLYHQIVRNVYDWVAYVEKCFQSFSVVEKADCRYDIYYWSVSLKAFSNICKF